MDTVVFGNMTNQIAALLQDLAASTSTLDEYIAAAISGGLRGDPGYDPATLDDMVAAAPQYDATELKKRAVELERAARDRREQIAREARDRMRPSQFASPRWIPDDNGDM